MYSSAVIAVGRGVGGSGRGYGGINGDGEKQNKTRRHF